MTSFPVPDKFPAGTEFFETEPGGLLVFMPILGWFALDGGVLRKASDVRSTEPMPLSEDKWRKLAAEAAAE